MCSFTHLHVAITQLAQCNDIHVHVNTTDSNCPYYSTSTPQPTHLHELLPVVKNLHVYLHILVGPLRAPVEHPVHQGEVDIMADIICGGTGGETTELAADTYIAIITSAYVSVS